MTQEDLLLPDGFSAPTGNGVGYQNWKLKAENDRLVLRVLPSWMNCLLEKGDFGLYWGDHYGYMGRDVKDPSKKAYRVFTCVEEKNYGIIVQECPQCKYVASKRKQFETAKATLDTKINELVARGKAKGVSDADINKAATSLRDKLGGEVAGLKEWLGVYGCNKKMRIPCIDKQGQFGVFLAPYGVVLGLRNEMNALKAQMYPGTNVVINAAGRKGVFFEILRTGKAGPKSDSVRVAMIQRDDGSEIKDFHVITNDQLEQARKTIPDLLELKNRNAIRIDQIQALVDLDIAGGGSSDPDEVDRILEIAKKQSKIEAEIQESLHAEEKITSILDIADSPVVVPVVPVPVVVAVPVAPVPVVVSTPTATPVPVVVPEESSFNAEEDFENMFK